MAANCIVLAVSSGNVVVSKQVLLNVDDQRLQVVMNAVRAQNPGCFVMFLNEQDVDAFAKKFMEERQKVSGGM